MKTLVTTILLACTLPLALAIGSFTRDQPQPDELFCTTSTESPLYLDCLHTYLSLPTSPLHLSASEVCSSPANDHIFINDWTLGTAGSCRILSYHDKGDAHCVPPELVKEALEAMFTYCVSTMKTEAEDAEGFDGRELQIVGGRWYIDGSSYGRQIDGSKAWIALEKVRP